MGLLKGVDDTLYDGDLTMIKEKIFKRCNGQGVGSLELIDVYTLVKQLEISFEDIDWLIEEGLCIEIPRAIKTVPYHSITTLPKISNLQTCKEFMNDKETFCKKHCDDVSYYDYGSHIRDYIDAAIMSCYLSLSPTLELEYGEYKKEHKTLKSTSQRFADLVGSSIYTTRPSSNLAWHIGNQGTSAIDGGPSNFAWPIEYNDKANNANNLDKADAVTYN